MEVEVDRGAEQGLDLVPGTGADVAEAASWQVCWPSARTFSTPGYTRPAMSTVLSARQVWSVEQTTRRNPAVPGSAVPHMA